MRISFHQWLGVDIESGGGNELTGFANAQASLSAGESRFEAWGRDRSCLSATNKFVLCALNHASIDPRYTQIHGTRNFRYTMHFTKIGRSFIPGQQLALFPCRTSVGFSGG